VLAEINFLADSIYEFVTILSGRRTAVTSESPFTQTTIPV
jgi:hypothetical protein